MIEWNDDQKQLIKTLDQFLSDTSSEEAFDYPFVVNGAAGCLVGSTKIKLLNGEIRTLKYLYNHKKDYIGKYVYSYDITLNKWVPGLITDIHNTGIKKIAKVTVENAKNKKNTFKCTYDHKFLTDSGKYIKAENLKENDRIESLYFKSIRRDRDYECFYTELDNKTEYTHRYVASLTQNIKNKPVHHIDENKYNNEPTNLLALTEKQHCSLHAKIRNKNGILTPITTARVTKYNKSGQFRKDSLMKETFVILKEFGDKINENTTLEDILEFRNKLINLGYLNYHSLKYISMDEFQYFLENISDKDAFDYHKNIKKNLKILEKNKNRLISHNKSGYISLSISQLKKLAKKINDYRPDILADNLNISRSKVNSVIYADFDSMQSWAKYCGLTAKRNHKVINVKLTNESQEVYDLTIKGYHNYGILDSDGNIIFTHNTGKTFTLTEHLNKTSLKYLFLCYTGKAANVCARHGIPSETIHHCLFLPTGLSTWQKFSQKIKYGLIDCKGTVTENPNWNGKDPNSQYVLNYTGDREVFYYIRKNSKGEDVEEIVDSEEDIPEGYEVLSRLEENVEQQILGRKEMFKDWNADDSNQMREFLGYQNIIGFEDLRDESEGGSWLFKLRSSRLYNIDVLVIDEYGMVPGDMMDQILKVCKEMKVKLILSGDPAQLSPISKTNMPLQFEATQTLNQIMRQEADNPILHFATLIRLYGVKKAFKQMIEHQSNKFVILSENDVSDDILRQYKSMNTQVICGTNRTRKWLNKRIKGNTKLEKGDKIIITEINDWDYNIDKSQYLTNGTQGIITDFELPEEHFYPEYRPVFDDVGDIDFEHPKLVEKPSKTDLKHDYRLSNYICKIDFESTEGDHTYDNRKLKTLPIAISRSIDDDKFDNFMYLPKSSIYGVTAEGNPRRVTPKDEQTYQYDYIVEHFEGSNREYNQVPKYAKDKETQFYTKAYKDYYSCPDFRKKRRTERLDNDEEHVIYNTLRTKPYYLNSHIAEHGYCITTHKSQGSEYDDVLVWFEPFGSSEKDICEWLYTAVTRAKETLVLVITKQAEEYLGYSFEENE